MTCSNEDYVCVPLFISYTIAHIVGMWETSISDEKSLVMVNNGCGQQCLKCFNFFRHVQFLGNGQQHIHHDGANHVQQPKRVFPPFRYPPWNDVLINCLRKYYSIVFFFVYYFRILFFFVLFIEKNNLK